MEQIDQTNFENVVLSNYLVNIFFFSKNVQQCDQIRDLLNELKSQESLKKVKFFSMDIENNSPLAKQFLINSVPTVILFQNGNEIDRVVGADTANIVQKLNKMVEANNSTEQRLIKLINQESVMIFIKGTPTQPRCKFTRAFIDLLNGLNAKYGYFDILSDMEVRECLKSFSNWPTYPQLYIKGKLVGGLDIAQTLHEDGELEKMLQS